MTSTAAHSNVGSLAGFLPGPGRRFLLLIESPRCVVRLPSAAMRSLGPLGVPRDGARPGPVQSEFQARAPSLQAEFELRRSSECFPADVAIAGYSGLMCQSINARGFAALVIGSDRSHPAAALFRAANPGDGRKASR